MVTPGRGLLKGVGVARTSGQQTAETPPRHHRADRHEPPCAWASQIAVDPFGPDPAPVHDQGVGIAREQSGADRQDQLGEKVVEVEEVGHAVVTIPPAASRPPCAAATNVTAMRHCYVLRVFTRGEDGGNHLGVVTDITGLQGDDMQRIAADLGFSETIFIDWRSEATPFVRIFTPAAELPFAGHPLVGAAWTLGVAGPGTVDRVRCAVGEIPFRVEGEAIWVDTPMVSSVSEAADGSEIAESSRLPATGRAWWVRMPIPYLMIEAPSASAVASADPDFESLADGPAAEACYLFAADGGHVKARFFAVGLGVREDPATGSAAAALAAVRTHEGEPAGHLVIRQGDEIGHPSTIELSWSPRAASLGGTVRRDEVRVLEG